MKSLIVGLLYSIKVPQMCSYMNTWVYYLRKTSVLCSHNKVTCGLEKLNSGEIGLMNELVVCSRLLL